jgi:chromatin remodeling complex protein RSC6
MPRTEVTKRLTAYIKEKSLQCQDNKKHFKCDAALARVFSVEENTITNWFEMQKFLAKLLTSVKKNETSVSNDTENVNEANIPVIPVDALAKTQIPNTTSETSKKKLKKAP